MQGFQIDKKSKPKLFVKRTVGRKQKTISKVTEDEIDILTRLHENITELIFNFKGKIK